MAVTTGGWGWITLVYSTLACATLWLMLRVRTSTPRVDSRTWRTLVAVWVSYCTTALLAWGRMIG